MINIVDYTKNIESKWLVKKLEDIDRKNLSDGKKCQQFKRTIAFWLFLANLVNVLSFTLIKFSYNKWAKNNNKKSRWLKFEGIDKLRDDLKTGKINEEPQVASASGAVDTHEANNEGDLSNSNDNNNNPSVTQKNDVDPNRLWNDPNGHMFTMQAVINWSQCIKVVFDVESDYVLYWEELIGDIESLIKLSDEWKRPALFIAGDKKDDVADNDHFIMGLYWNKRLLMIDPKGNYHVDILEENLSNILIFSSSTPIQRPEDTTSSGVIVSELAIHFATQFTLSKLTTKVENYSDVNKMVDISEWLPSSLQELRISDVYDERTEGIRTEQTRRVEAALPDEDIQCYIDIAHEGYTQYVFNQLANGKKIEDLGEDAQNWLDELGIDGIKIQLKSTPQKLEDYQLSELTSVGKGCFGQVVKYHGRDRRVAVKLFVYTEKAQKYFNQESETLLLNRHPNIVHAFECGEITFASGHRRYSITMEYAILGDLNQFIKDTTLYPPIFEIQLSFAKHLTAGLSFLHHQADRMHRDIKDENILVTWDAGNLKLMYTDFNLSAQIQDYPNSDEHYVGCPMYTAPEIWKGDSPNTPFSDVYALSLVLWQIFMWKNLEHSIYTNYYTHDQFIRYIIMRDRPENPADIPNPKMAELLGKMMSKAWKQRPTADYCDYVVGEELSRLSSLN